MHKRPESKASMQTVPQLEQQKQSLDFILPDPMMEWSDSDSGGVAVVLRSRRLGDETIPEALGESLMATFIRTMAGSPAVPASLLLYGSAVCLAASDSFYLEALSRMQAHGCEILCCQISFSALTEEEKPAVGQLADWVDLTDRMQKSKQVLWP